MLKLNLKFRTLRLTELKNELMVAGVRRGIVTDFGKVMYTLLYLKWITNKNLLYSTQNSVQCYVPDRMAVLCASRVSRRMNTCIRMAESLHCSPETMTTLLIDCTPVKNVFSVKKIKNKKKKKFKSPDYMEKNSELLTLLR